MSKKVVRNVADIVECRLTSANHFAAQARTIRKAIQTQKTPMTAEQREKLAELDAKVTFFREEASRCSAMLVTSTQQVVDNG